MTNTQHTLIPILQRGEQEQWVDARTLHQFLEVGKDFSTWIKDFIADFDFVEGRDFSPNLGKSTGGRSAIEYTITLDMAKELAMLQRTEKGKQARQYFIAAEKELRRLQANFLHGFAEVVQILKNADKTEVDGFLWYPIGHLRRLAGKSTLRSSVVKRKREILQNKIIMMPYKGWQAWWVRQDAVQDILCVKQHHSNAVAMVKLLNTGGIA